MDNFRDLPKSIKILIFLVSTTIFLLITNFIFYSVYKHNSEKFIPMNYYIDMLNEDEDEILERFDKIGIKYDDSLTMEQSAELYYKLYLATDKVDSKLEDIFENKNPIIPEFVDNLENYSGLIINYNIKNGISNDELADVINNYKKNNKGNNVFSFSNNGVQSSQVYYQMAMEVLDFENGTGRYEGRDTRYSDVHLDISHKHPEEDLYFPQYFIIEDGKVNEEKTKELSKNTIPLINIESDVRGEY